MASGHRCSIEATTWLLRLLPARLAGWGLHPLEGAAFARRIPATDIPKHLGVVGRRMRRLAVLPYRQWQNRGGVCW